MIPIESAEALAHAHGLQQVIVFGFDGKETFIATWGETAEQSQQAAVGANVIKRQWGWPDSTIVDSQKVVALKNELADVKRNAEELQALVNSNHNPLQHIVHIIEGTEYERGWGSRPDGYVAFLSKEAALDYIDRYNAKYNTAPHAPAEYTTYSFKGAMIVPTEIVLKITRSAAKLLHFDRMSEINAIKTAKPL